MPDWTVTVMFYGLVALIIGALIAEFRGTVTAREHDETTKTTPPPD